ncbi:MAG: zinc ribbon domain-containing protein [Bacteroidetes bacterium]|nr:zinc ribbon domain-containing protein [Bacteroidota bacterium]
MPIIKFVQVVVCLLKEMPKGEGSKSELYCSYCYEKGAFSFNESLHDFQDYCKEQMIEGGHNRFIAWLLTRGMGRLPRWKK